MQYGPAVWIGALILGAAVAPQFGAAEEATPAIVHLAFRDHVVTIHAAAGGPSYSVRSRDGAILDAGLSDAELLAAYPQLHERIRAGYASDDSGSFVWAGRDERFADPPAESTLAID